MTKPADMDLPDVEFAAVRNGRRYRVCIPVTLSRSPEETLCSGVAENISATGCLVTHPSRPIEVGEVFEIRFLCLGTALHTRSLDSLCLQGKAVWQEDAGIGVEFTEPAPELEELLDRAFARGTAGDWEKDD